MMFPLPFNLKMLAIGGSIVAIIGAMIFTYNHIYNSGETAGETRIQLRWDEVEAARNKVIADLKTDAIAKELDFKAAQLKQQKESNEKINNLNKSIASITRELQQRPDRPTDPSSADVPSNTNATVGATGAELYRPDAEFLIREAARADKVRIQLEICTAQYNSVYEAFKK